MSAIEQNEPKLEDVETYWNQHPAGWAEVAHLGDDRAAMFAERDRQTAALYPDLAADYDFAGAAGRRTLEVGCGMGYNARCLAEAGAQITVMDLAIQAVGLTRERFALRGLTGNFLVADAEHLPFRAGTFERVYSSGVIHHSPNTQAAADEITRVLEAGGRAVVMVYHRDSVWYWWNIRLVLGGLMGVLAVLPTTLREKLLTLRPVWRDLVLPAGQKLTVVDVVRAGTDFGGLQNPISRVYTRRGMAELFGGLRVVRFATQFNRWGALGRQTWWVRLISWGLGVIDRHWGWFLILHGEK